MSSPTKWTIHVEVRLKLKASARYDTIRSLVLSYLATYDRLSIPATLDGWKDVPELACSVEHMHVCESPCPKRTLTQDEMSLQVHVYQPSDVDAFEEFSNSTGSRDEDDTTAASVCELPNRTYVGLWESLIYGDNIKLKLLDYIHATLILSDANVDFNLVSWNRVVLLHGPPGTGKTSLCRALAQKLAIRLSHRYSQARLLEINSHSLFSKWFSESGKLVQRLFTGLTELIDEEDSFVVVLIDEVESLTAARAGAMAGTEPSDGLRVVNALLTQLDKLKHRKNVLVMATSNLVKAIDCAFVDRADIIQYIDLPSPEAIYDILRSSHMEMAAKGILLPITIPKLQEVHIYAAMAPSGTIDKSEPADWSKNVGLRLLNLAEKCQAQGMSGRALRKLPVTALARYIGIGNVSFASSGSASSGGMAQGAPFDVWMDSMENVINERQKEYGHINSA